MTQYCMSKPYSPWYLFFCPNDMELYFLSPPLRGELMLLSSVIGYPESCLLPLMAAMLQGKLSLDGKTLPSHKGWPMQHTSKRKALHYGCMYFNQICHVIYTAFMPREGAANPIYVKQCTYVGGIARHDNQCIGNIVIRTQKCLFCRN